MKSIFLRMAGLGALIVTLGVAGCGLLEPDDQYTLLRERFGAELIAKIESGTIRLEGGDGSTVKSAVKIVGVATEREREAAEFWFLSKKFGREGIEWAPRGERALAQEGRRYDVRSIELAGEKAYRSAYFDLTEFQPKKKEADVPGQKK